MGSLTLEACRSPLATLGCLLEVAGGCWAAAVAGEATRRSERVRGIAAKLLECSGTSCVAQAEKMDFGFSLGIFLAQLRLMVLWPSHDGFSGWWRSEEGDGEVWKG